MAEQQSITRYIENAPNLSAQGDEIDLGALFSKIWQRRMQVLALTLLVPALIVAYHLFKKAIYIPGGYELPLMFSFAGAEKGEYPNGERFLIADIVSNEVLAKAMKEVGAPEDIIRATTIHAGNGLTETVETSIVARLQDKKLTENQLQALNDGLERAHSLARQYAVLAVDADKTSADVGQIRAYLNAIPRLWSERAVNDLGVLEVEHQVANNPFRFDESASLVREFFRFESYLDLLDRSLEELGSYGVANLSALSGPSNQRLSEINLHLDSVRTEFNDLISMMPYAVGQEGQGSDRVSGSLLAAKRLNLELQRDKLRNMVAVYDESLALLGRQDIGATAELRGETVKVSSNGGVYSPQLSDQMFESLLQLGKTVSDSEQRAMIIEKRIAASEQIQEVNLQLARLESAESGNATYRQLLDKQSILELLKLQVQSANQIQTDLKDIALRVSELVLGTNAVLWEPLGNVSEARAKATAQKRLIMQAVIALILGAMVGVIAALMMPARERLG